jgi:hypothetical protein
VSAPAEPALARAPARRRVRRAEDLQLYRWQLSNGSGPELPSLGDGDLLALAAGRLETPPDFLERNEPALLPAVGAALDAVREGTVPVNLLPVEGRRGYDEGLSLVTVVLVAVLGVLLLVWGGSALVKAELLRREVHEKVVVVQPQVKEVRALQDQIALERRQLDILTGGQDRHVIALLKELSDIVPADAHLTSANLRSGQMTLDGCALGLRSDHGPREVQALQERPLHVAHHEDGRQGAIRAGG